MNSLNILSVISTYLDLKTLLSFTQVNRLFNKASRTNKIWKPHFFNAFFGDLSLFGEISSGPYDYPSPFLPDYYCLLQQRGLVLSNWNSPFSDGVLIQDFHDLKTELFSALKEPLLPLPSLRREGYFFPTIVQDLIGNAFSPLTPSEIPFTSPALEFLQNSLDTLELNFTDSDQIQTLSNSRWLLKNKSEACGQARNSLASQSTSAETEKNPNILIMLMKTIKDSIKIHCKGVVAYLGGIKENLKFLSVYCLLWEAYSASIQRLETVFMGFTDVVNQVYDSKIQFAIRTPAYSMMRLMVIIWRRVVILQFSDRLALSIQEILKSHRTALVNSAEFDKKQLDLLCKTVQGLVDISVNEVNIHLLNHSKFVTTGEYAKIHSIVIQSTQEFYEGLSSRPQKEVEAILRKDLRFLQRAFLQCTWAQVKKLNIEIQLSMLRKCYINLYDDFKIYDCESEPQPLINTSFSQMLFQHKPSLTAKSHIKVFIKYLINLGHREDINHYNTLNEEYEDLSQDKILQDEEIEYRTKNFNWSPDEAYLFDISSDIDFQDFMIISVNSTHSY